MVEKDWLCSFYLRSRFTRSSSTPYRRRVTPCLPKRLSWMITQLCSGTWSSTSESWSCQASSWTKTTLQSTSECKCHGLRSSSQARSSTSTALPAQVRANRLQEAVWVALKRDLTQGICRKWRGSKPSHPLGTQVWHASLLAWWIRSRSLHRRGQAVRHLEEAEPITLLQISRILRNQSQRNLVQPMASGHRTVQLSKHRLQQPISWI